MTDNVYKRKMRYIQSCVFFLIQSKQYLYKFVLCVCVCVCTHKIGFSISRYISMQKNYINKLNLEWKNLHLMVKYQAFFLTATGFSIFFYI